MQLRQFSTASSAQFEEEEKEGNESYDDDFYQNNSESSAFNKMPVTMQREVVKCLKTLEIQSSETHEAIDIKRIKEQYLKLAQQYHPDVIGNQDDQEEGKKAEEMFIEIKESFDRLVQLNEEFGGNLLTDPEADLAAHMEKEARRQQMHEVRMKIARAKKERRDNEAGELQRLEEEMKEQHRIRELRRRAVVERQIAELARLRQYEIKMLVRLDKEYSDITYIPTNSLGMQIAELCKRNHQHRNPEDELHGRPYYDYEQQIKQFDESSLGSSSRVESNPELLAKLQAEMGERKKREQRE